MRARLQRREQAGLAAALAICAAALLLGLVDSRAALTGWLGASITFAAIPAGAMCLHAMMKLIPGAWGEDMRLTCEAGTLLAVPGLIAFVPVILGAALIYPWAGRHGHSSFQDIWLGVVPFAVRTLLWFALLSGASWMLRNRRATRLVSVLALMAFPLLGTFVAVDWLMSLDLDFASSGFGLQMLILWTCLAFAALLVLRLTIGRTPRRSAVLGALLLTLLLMWAYIQFLIFFISWSPGLPEGAAWYLRRASPGWAVSSWAFAVLGGVPLLMLLFARFRASAAWIVRLSLAVIGGKIIEFAWFALPGTGMIGILAFGLATMGLALTSAILLPVALRLRIVARMPKAQHP